LPVLRANKLIKQLAAGDELTVLATDAAAPADFRSYCETAGHHLVDISEQHGVIRVILRKGA
jgi:tRNA 2-thiouridine synthesizing protein A